MQTRYHEYSNMQLFMEVISSQILFLNKYSTLAAGARHFLFALLLFFSIILFKTREKFRLNYLLKIISSYLNFETLIELQGINKEELFTFLSPFWSLLSLRWFAFCNLLKKFSLFSKSNFKQYIYCRFHLF